MIGSLTGLRAAAALLVFLFHASVFHGGGATFIVRGFDNGIVRSGDFGVDIFFVLSGFVIAHVYAERVHPFTASAYARFIWFRIARLLPMHYFTMGVLLAAYVVYSRVAGHATEHSFEFAPQSVVASLLFVHEWFAGNNFIARLPVVREILSITGPIGTPNSVSWSISAEFLAYLLFPVILALVRRSNRQLAMGIVLGAGTLLATLHSIPRDNIVRVLVCFATGVVTQQILAMRASSRPLRLPVPAPLRGVAIVVLIAVLLGFFRTADGGPAYMLDVALVALLIAVLCDPRDALARMLSTKTMIYLGEISYAFYMLHWFVLKLGERIFGRSVGLHQEMSYVFMLTTLAATTLLAAAFYQLLENPARGALQDLYGRRRKPAFR